MLQPFLPRAAPRFFFILVGKMEATRFGGRAEEKKKLRAPAPFFGARPTFFLLLFRFLLLLLLLFWKEIKRNRGARASFLSISLFLSFSLSRHFFSLSLSLASFSLRFSLIN